MKRLIILVALLFTVVQPTKLFPQNQQKTQTLTAHRFGFSVNYVPYYSGNWYQVSLQAPQYWMQYAVTLNLLNNAVRFTELQAYFSYFVFPKISLNVTVGYNGFDQTDNYDSRTEYPPYDSQHQNQHNGYDISLANKQFLMRLDVRYYLRARREKQVSPFAQVGGGKYFATGDNTISYWDKVNEPHDKFDFNAKDFLSDFNSPLVVDFGLGAEYYFNTSLALHASMIAYYTNRSGTAKYRYQNLDENYTSYWQHKFKRNEWQTQIGIGLTFLF